MFSSLLDALAFTCGEESVSVRGGKAACGQTKVEGKPLRHIHTVQACTPRAQPPLSYPPSPSRTTHAPTRAQVQRYKNARCTRWSLYMIRETKRKTLRSPHATAHDLRILELMGAAGKVPPLAPPLPYAMGLEKLCELLFTCVTACALLGVTDEAASSLRP